MAGVLDSVNQRTQLVGQNRLELLLFRLDGSQLYGINVFKVKEILPCPRLSNMPKSSSVVCGVANIRGGTIRSWTWPWPPGGARWPTARTVS